MNLTWHIVKKDLFYFRWAFAIWLGCFALMLFLQGNVTLSNSANVQDFLRGFALVLFGLLSLGLITGLVHEDNPDDNCGFWRTRPISAGRLVAAKLLLIGALFIVLPLAAVALKDHFSELKKLNYFREYCLMVLILSSLSLSLTAVATCTKNVLHCLLLWLGVIFATGSMVEALDRFVPVLSRHTAMQMNINRVLAMLGFSAIMALAIILNQYLRRRLTASVVLLIFGSVGSALIGSAWGYYYFYHS